MEDIGYLLFLFVINIVLSFIFGKIGKKREIGFGWAFAATFFLGLIGIIIVLCSKKIQPEFIDVEKKSE